MVEILMREFGSGDGFWCMSKGKWMWAGLTKWLRALEKKSRPAVLFGTAFGWMHFLDWCRHRNLSFCLPKGSLVLETGGYKGRSREWSRSELHQSLAGLLHLNPRQVCSEYSMCEISSQAYSIPQTTFPATARSNNLSRHGGIIFQFPPWCRHRVVRPGTSRPAAEGECGVLEVIDLANLDSCAFIRTEDLAIDRGNGFELVSRLPGAGLKGCSLAFEPGI